MTSVTLEDAAKTLERYGLGHARLTLLSNVDCTVFHVREPAFDGNVQSSSAVLKVYPEQKQDITAIETEIEWLQALLRDTPLIVPAPRSAIDGSIIQRVESGPLAGPPCVLFSWVDGRSRHDNPAVSDLRQVGRFVAQLHGHSFRWSHTHTARLTRRTSTWQAPAWVLERERPPTVSEPEWTVLTGCADKLQRAMANLRDDPTTFGIIHSDLSLTNFLFGDRGVGLIDFSDCAWGHYADDIASVVAFLEHPWVHREDGPSATACLDSFFGGYAEERTLPPQLDQALDVYVPARVFLQAAYLHSAKDVVPWIPSWLDGAFSYLERFVSEP